MGGGVRLLNAEGDRGDALMGKKVEMTRREEGWRARREICTGEGVMDGEGRGLNQSNDSEGEEEEVA